MNTYLKGLAIAAATVAALLTITVTAGHAAASLYTDISSWESMVFGSELFQTTATNVALADEIFSVPGPNSKPGSILTFQASNTGLSRGFFIESLQARGTSDIEAGFTFDDNVSPGDKEGGINDPTFDNALSVGDYNDWENDDWSLGLLNGATMTAFGVELRDTYFYAGESISLYSGNTLIGTVDLGFLQDNVEYPSVFIGLTSDSAFDRVDFDEAYNGKERDDIAIADFRFANTTVVPEPASMVLFAVGAATFAAHRGLRKKKHL